MMASISGPVRYRFRDTDDDVEVLLEGDSEWVERWRQELGLEEVGWLQPLQAEGAELTEAGESAPRKERQRRSNWLVRPPTLHGFQSVAGRLVASISMRRYVNSDSLNLAHRQERNWEISSTITTSLQSLPRD